MVRRPQTNKMTLRKTRAKYCTEMQSHKCKKREQVARQRYSRKKSMAVYSGQQTTCEPVVWWYGKMAEPVLSGMSNGSVCKPREAIISLWSLLGCAGGEAGPIMGTTCKGNAEQEEGVQGIPKKWQLSKTLFVRKGLRNCWAEFRDKSRVLKIWKNIVIRRGVFSPRAGQMLSCLIAAKEI